MREYACACQCLFMTTTMNPRLLWRLFHQSPSVRQRRWIVGSLLLILVFYFTFKLAQRPRDIFNWPRWNNTSETVTIDLDQPPSYARLKKWETDLPQHNLDLPLPEGGTGRYVLFKNQVVGLGWNNELNEVLMNTWLAYKSKRAYVFQNHVWNLEHYPWPKEKYRESRPWTPLNALLSGPPAGGLWESGDDAPRSVSEDWFNTVCPQSERRIIFTGDVKPAVYWEEGDVIFKHWEKLLTDAPERCIEVQASNTEKDGTPQTFDLWLWGSTRVLSLWDEFKNSPVSRLLGPSPIVKAAVDRNEYLFLPRGPRPTHSASRNPYERMLAIHLRRGDFKTHCLTLANWNATFYSWNLLPFLPDKFVHPSSEGYEWGKNTPEAIAHYQKHCYPDQNFILDKIHQSREDYLRAARPGEYRALDVIFLLTNDATEWIEELKTTLRRSGWHTVVATRDLELDQEQKDVNLAVDMDFGRRAAVFIGNGWSSYTSNIVHQRLVGGKEPISTRFF